MRLQDNLEVELKLTVTGDDPERLLDEIAALRSLGGVRLADAQVLRLRDIYWDTADYGLRARKLSLRLREIDGRQVFTVKGGTSSSEGLFRRYELEVPATAQNWLDVCAVFHDEGVDLAKANGTVSGVSPDDLLRAAGLQPTQDRSTRRTAIHAYDDAHGDHALAELALDRTRFDFGRVLVDYWEIEIEELGNHGDEVPRRIGQALRERYPDRLEPSTMGKYSRGLAIERELRTTGQL